MVVYLINIKHIKKEQFKLFLQELPMIRQKKLLSYKHESDFLASIAGDMLLSYGLKEIYSINKLPEIYYGENGKPYFPDLDIFLIFLILGNMSHVLLEMPRLALIFKIQIICFRNN